ncbi:MAG: PaaI family thioesterase [Gammaproteobacteria bacterium]|nr:PaaI family thioesterase [Gammaproteobacteria bacterium]
MDEKQYFQDYMPGNTCFGCGSDNEKGLKIRSYWQDDIATCLWKPEPHHLGWAGLTCGGVIASLVDCHCIATAMATAIKNENRSLDSEPKYLFATGSINITYLKPTPIDQTMCLKAKVIKVKNEKKYTLECDVFVGEEKTATAQVVALLVYRSDRPDEAPAVFKQS